MFTFLSNFGYLTMWHEGRVTYRRPMRQGSDYCSDPCPEPRIGRASLLWTPSCRTPFGPMRRFGPVARWRFGVTLDKGGVVRMREKAVSGELFMGEGTRVLLPDRLTVFPQMYTSRVSQIASQAGSPFVRRRFPMTDSRHEQIKNALDTYTKKITASSQQAREALVQAGIYKCNGKLNTNYTAVKAVKR